MRQCLVIRKAAEGRQLLCCLVQEYREKVRETLHSSQQSRETQLLYPQLSPLPVVALVQGPSGRMTLPQPQQGGLWDGLACCQGREWWLWELTARPGGRLNQTKSRLCFHGGAATAQYDGANYKGLSINKEWQNHVLAWVGVKSVRHEGHFSALRSPNRGLPSLS